jgi:hypothetical protein
MLGHVVELVALKVKPAHHGANQAGTRVHRNERPFDLGQLPDCPFGIAALLYTDHCTTSDLVFGAGLVGQCLANGLQAHRSQSRFARQTATPPAHAWVRLV